MGSQKLSGAPQEREPLEKLALKVSKFASYCDPDYRCSRPELFHDLCFKLDEPLDKVMLQLRDKTYEFSEWSRSQLLAHLGTREKWFDTVSLLDQVIELNRRLHTLDEHRLRIMRTPDEDTNILRGLVSKHYAEIPDTLIMEALLQAAPEASYHRGSSGKTDKAFYAYLIHEASPIGPKDMQILPGAVFRNSEVGFTSLWITPALVINGHQVILRREMLLRKAHRGSVVELQEAFSTALGKLSAVWAPIAARLNALHRHVFADEAKAREVLKQLLTGIKATKSFIRACDSTYVQTHRGTHSARTLFDAVLQATTPDGLDLVYEKGELAGLFLYRLL